ncbi:uncharacterized protein LOC121430570 [Lytechinus variegatus]|uniref:uncharacterized protein LOC121430570 n=1 Tax=Lytechinus variegatus TaxID=7654 RepID=UPI001BB1C2B2|nr:uncharacterized protein LOC121430570 [Lytechinus variegatus]
MNIAPRQDAFSLIPGANVTTNGCRSLSDTSKHDGGIVMELAKGGESLRDGGGGGVRDGGGGDVELIPPTQYCKWVEKTYGDSGKTKTVTRKKYNRIVAVLKGDELPSAENGRFRFWIKGKNFKLAAAEKGQPDYGQKVLYVPVKSTELTC